MYFKTCRECGAHLDPGETCDCEIEREQRRKETERLHRELLVIEGNGQLRMAFKEIAIA